MILIIRKVLLLVSLVAFVTTTMAADYAGPRKCRNCHRDQYTDWKDSHHAHAYSESFEQLWHKNGSKPSCLTCHTTGHEAGTEDYVHPGVTCESCHGVMSKGHSKKEAEMPLPITSEVCESCHKRVYQQWEISQHGQNGIRCFDCHGVHAQPFARKVETCCAEPAIQNASKPLHTPHTNRKVYIVIAAICRGLPIRRM